MKMYWVNSGAWSCNMAVRLWVGTGCIIKEERVHEDVVGLMWHGRKACSEPFCVLRGKVIEGKEFVHHRFWLL